MDLHAAIRSQYGASLEMLKRAIEACPGDLWDAGGYPNRFWHVAYHALFYTHLYLSRSEADFEGWEKARPDYCFLGPKPWPPHDMPVIGEPYSRADVVEYRRTISDRIGGLVTAAPLDEPSGFHWLPFSRMELHLYNIRHVQHHAGQLIERLRRETGAGIDWVGKGS